MRGVKKHRNTTELRSVRCLCGKATITATVMTLSVGVLSATVEDEIVQVGSAATVLAWAFVEPIMRLARALFFSPTGEYGGEGSSFCLRLAQTVVLERWSAFWVLG